jgi:hypothetical protein
MEPVHERHGHDPPGADGRGRHPGGPGGVDGDRLLADHVLAGGQGGQRQRLVQVVGRTQVDDVDAVVRDELVTRREDPFGAQLGRRPLGRAGRGGRDAHEPAPGQAGGPGVDPADEPRTGDADP